MTVDECATLRNARDGCYGFEYGVAYGGGVVYKPHDYQLENLHRVQNRLLFCVSIIDIFNSTIRLWSCTDAYSCIYREISNNKLYENNVGWGTIRDS